MMTDVTGFLQNVEAAAIRSGRKLEDITIVAASKTVPFDAINKIMPFGITNFGENKVQEFQEKYEHVQGAKWHIIGHLQTNKVRHVVGRAELIQSVDSIKLANEVNLCAQKQNIVQNILVQVNVENENTKFGVSSDECEDMLLKLGKLDNIKVCGLMFIPPNYSNNELVRKTLRKCNNLFIDIREKKHHNISMDILSMGMSNDYEIAIEEGATMIRPGSVLFGKRIYQEV